MPILELGECGHWWIEYRAPVFRTIFCPSDYNAGVEVDEGSKFGIRGLVTVNGNSNWSDKIWKQTGYFSPSCNVSSA